MEKEVIASKPLVLPPESKLENEGTEISIIKGLSFNDRIKEIAFELSGWEKNPLDEDEWRKTGNPIMNQKGIINLTHCLRSISEKIYTMGHLKEKQVGRLIRWYARQNFPHFVAYAEEFGLAEENYNLIWNYLLLTGIGGTTKALNAGDRNVVRGVYSEDTLSKIYGGQNKSESPQQERRGLFGFKKRR